MKPLISLFSIFFFLQCFSQPLFQLAPPILKYPSAFFSSNTSFEVIFDQPGAEIHYTLNGKEPTEQDLLYSGAVPVTSKTVVKVKAFGKDFLPSETISATFIKNGKAIRKIQFSKPNESYANAKADILNDNIGGLLNYRSGTWLGYSNDTVTIQIDLEKKEKISSILISLLQDENSWIFLPEELTVYYYDEKKSAYVSAGKETFSHTEAGPKQSTMPVIRIAPGTSCQKLQLVLLPLKKIPDWHNGKGNHGWLFIDEIKVY